MTLSSKKLLTYAVLALFASHLIACLGTASSITEVMNRTGYLYALLCGTAIAFGILYALPFVTRILNKSLPWHSNPFKRTVAQFFVGILLPFLVIMLLTTGCFWAAGIWILETEWLENCSTAIVFMLCFADLLNELFADAIFEIPPVKENIQIEPEPPQTESEPPQIMMFKGRPYSDVIYVNAENGKNMIMFKDGAKYPYPKSINFARTMLPESTHLLSTRGQIIAFASIQNAKWMDGQRLRIQVFLKEHESFKVIFSENQTATHRDLLRPYMGGTD